MSESMYVAIALLFIHMYIVNLHKQYVRVSNVLYRHVSAMYMCTSHWCHVVKCCHVTWCTYVCTYVCAVVCCRCEVPDVEDYGNKWSASAALRHLRRAGLDTPTLVLRIEDAIIKSILSVAPTVAMAATMFQPHYKNCFGTYSLLPVESNAREQLEVWCC